MGKYEAKWMGFLLSERKSVLKAKLVTELFGNLIKK